MARRPRMQQQVLGAYYHVMNRGHNREVVFQVPEDCAYVVDLLARYRERFPVKLYPYCLMSNHFHLLVHCEQPSAPSGSPGPGRRGPCGPRLPQIRTCPIEAYGSSRHGFAYPTAHRMDHQGGWKHITPQQPVKGSPRKEDTPSAACQPFLPDTHHPVTETLQR